MDQGLGTLRFEGEYSVYNQSCLGWALAAMMVVAVGCDNCRQSDAVGC